MTGAVCIAHGGDLGEPSGGTDRVGAVAGGLAARGHDVTVVAPVPTASPTLPRSFDGVRFLPVRVPSASVADQPLRAVRVVRRALRVARERGATLQIEHATLAGVATLFGASEYVLDMHDVSSRSPLYGDLPGGRVIQAGLRRLEGRALDRAREVVVVSDAMADLVAETWPVRRGSLRVVPNGFDPETVAPYRGVTTDPGRVAFLGTLHRKVDAEALRAVAELPAVDDCVVIGDGERRGELEALAAETPALRTTGRLPDAEAFPLVASAAVALNPQHASGVQAASSPVKFYYYGALGLPMVLSEGPAAARELAEAGAARLVPAGESAAFAGAVAELLGDEAARERASGAARNAVRDATWERRIDRFAEVYAG